MAKKTESSDEVAKWLKGLTITGVAGGLLAGLAWLLVNGPTALDTASKLNAWLRDDERLVGTWSNHFEGAVDTDEWMHVRSDEPRGSFNGRNADLMGALNARDEGSV